MNICTNLKYLQAIGRSSHYRLSWRQRGWSILPTYGALMQLTGQLTPRTQHIRKESRTGCLCVSVRATAVSPSSVTVIMRI